MILSKLKDPRLVTLRRGGLLVDEDHRRLALWAALCAEHVLELFEARLPEDDRPRAAVRAARSWSAGEIRTTEAKVAAYYANLAGRDAPKAAKYAAYAAGQAAVVAHVPEHALGAAAYAIRAVMEAAGEGEAASRAREEWAWQKSCLPNEILDLVLEDSLRRDSLCWGVFSL